MTDLARHIEAMRETVDEMVDATDPRYRDALAAAIEANRQARAQNDRDMLALQDEINRRAAAFGEGFEQAMRLAADSSR